MFKQKRFLNQFHDAQGEFSPGFDLSQRLSAETRAAFKHMQQRRREKQITQKEKAVNESM